MKKQNIIVLAIVGLLLFIILPIVFVIIFFTKNLNIFSQEIKENTSEVEERVTILQSDMSPFVFSTEEDDKNDILDIHIVYQPFLSISLNTDSYVKNFSIENITVKTSIGEVAIITPKAVPIEISCRSFLLDVCDKEFKSKDIKSSGKNISFKVVDNVKNIDEVLNQDAISPNFYIIVKNIGTISQQQIMNRDKLFSGEKLIEYVGIESDKLDSQFSYDIKIVFDDNKIYRKRMVGEFDGESIKNLDFYTIKMIPKE